MPPTVQGQAGTSSSQAATTTTAAVQGLPGPGPSAAQATLPGTSSLTSYPGVAAAPWEYIGGFFDDDGTILSVINDAIVSIQINFYQLSQAYLDFIRRHLLSGRGSAPRQILSDTAIQKLRAEGADVGKDSDGSPVFVFSLVNVADQQWFLANVKAIRTDAQILLASKLLQLASSSSSKAFQIADEITRLNRAKMASFDQALSSRFTKAYMGGIF